MLIAFSGKTLMGKTTAAQYLRDEHGFTIVSFAAALKDKVRDDFGFTEEQVRGVKKDEVDPRYKVTPRAILIAVGNLYRRFDPDFWVKKALSTITLHGKLVPGKYVIDDCRFKNEATHVSAVGGHVVRLSRPGVEPSDLSAAMDLSETDMDDYPFLPGMLLYSESIEIMHERVDGVLTYLSSNATMYPCQTDVGGVHVI